MCQTDKYVVAQGLKVVFILNLIIIDHSIMIQAFRFIEISKYDDGGQLMTAANLCLEAVHVYLVAESSYSIYLNMNIAYPWPFLRQVTNFTWVAKFTG